MPSTLITESAQNDPTDEIVLRDENGELTMEADTVADFMLSLDFSALADCEALKPHITEMEIDGETCKVAPLSVVMDLVDQDDLYEMFLNHLDNLPADSLEEKARVAVWANYFGGNLEEENGLSDAALDAALSDVYAEIDANDDLDEASKAASKMAAKKAAQKAGKLTAGATDAKGKIKKGGLKKLAKSSDAPKRNTAVRMMLAMRHKGIATEQDGKVVIDKAASKKGGTPAGKQKVAKFKKSIGVAESEDGVVLGHAVPLNGLVHAASAREMDEDALAAFHAAHPSSARPPAVKPTNESRQYAGPHLLEGAGLAGAIVTAGAKRDIIGEG